MRVRFVRNLIICIPHEDTHLHPLMGFFFFFPKHHQCNQVYSGHYGRSLLIDTLGNYYFQISLLWIVVQTDWVLCPAKLLYTSINSRTIHITGYWLKSLPSFSTLKVIADVQWSVVNRQKSETCWRLCLLTDMIPSYSNEFFEIHRCCNLNYGLNDKNFFFFFLIKDPQKLCENGH